MTFWFPAPNVSTMGDVLVYASNVTSIGYNTASPFPVLGLLIELAVFLIIFMGLLASVRASLEYAFASASFVVFSTAIILYVLEILPDIGVAIAIVMIIASVFIVHGKVEGG